MVTTQTPTDLRLVDGGNFVDISWQSEETAFEVYRNDSLIANVTQTNFLDYDIVDGHTYCYKVRAKEGDCISEFSDTICMSIIGLYDVALISSNVILYPNPTHGKVKLEIYGLSNEADVLVFDMVGRVIQRHKISRGENDLEIDLREYAKGIYYVRILNDNIRISRKVVLY